MVDLHLQETLHLLSILNLHNPLLSDLQHPDDSRVDGLLACQEEQVQHLLAKLLWRIVVAHHRVVHLTETAEAVQAKLVDSEEYFWDSFADLFLELPNHLEYVICAEYLLHSDDSLAVDDEDVPLVRRHEPLDIVGLDAD